MTITPAQTGYAPVNGLDMYYEVYGTGQPLVLLHGGFGVIGMFEQLLAPLAETRQVIAVEMQAHGRTADIDRPFSFEQLADDSIALVRHLGLEQADILGFSLGGLVAQQAAFRHPDVVRKLVIVSAPYKRDGWYPEVLAGMGSVNADALVGTIMHDSYVSLAPKPEDWSRLANKSRELLGQDYSWAEEVAALKAPTLILLGDADSIPPAHAAEMFALLGGGKADGGWDGAGCSNAQLAVLPGTTHFNLLARTDLLLPIITPFLDAPLPSS